MTVKLSMRVIQSNPKLRLYANIRRIYTVTLTKRVNIYVVILSNENLNSLRGPFPSSLPNFFTATNSKDRQTIDGESSAECRANFLRLLAEHSTH